MKKWIMCFLIRCVTCWINFKSWAVNLVCPKKEVKAENEAVVKCMEPKPVQVTKPTPSKSGKKRGRPRKKTEQK